MKNTLLKRFGLSQNPFTRKVPPEALLHHQAFEEAQRRVLFSVELESIVAVFAEPGCGKSLLLGEVADDLQRDGWAIDYTAHSTVGPFGLVNMLARKLGLSPRRSRGETALYLTETMLTDGRRHLLAVDEAHQLRDDTLEDIRLLTITDFDRQSPFLLLLAGRPSLEDRLADPIHHALDQRITTVARLMPLSDDETRQYIERRLDAAGASRPIFDDGAVAAIHEAADGVPRRINSVSTSALIVAAARGKKLVSAQDVQDARLDRGRP